MADRTPRAEREEDRDEDNEDHALDEAFLRTVEEGVRRTHRTWPALLATGLVGGLDVGIGVFAALVVLEETGNQLLAALAFTLGFVALVLARSELFTENFLVPIAAAVARRTTFWQVVRLWGGTLAMNLVGGWVVMALVIAAFPRLSDDAVALGDTYIIWGIGWSSMAAALLAGMVITLMTWIERTATSPTARLAAAVVTGFPLFAGPLAHTVVSAHELSAALHAGAPFGYLDASGAVAWAALGNVVGGIGLVTVLRLVQVGRRAVAEATDGKPSGS